MLIRIDYQDSRPIYEQIASGFEKLLLSGVIEAAEQMPSVRSLAVELSTNPNTVQKAYSQLERDGFIYTVKGKGNFVQKNIELVEKKKQEIIVKIRKILEEAEEIGLSRKELLKSLEE